MSTQTKPGILICEDDKAAANGLKMMCEGAGYGPVIIVGHKSQVVDAWQNGHFNALLMDLHLAGSRHWYEGFDLIKQINFLEGRPKRVFIYSGHIDSVNMTVIAAVAPDRVRAFHKSTQRDELSEALEDFVGEFNRSPMSSVIVASQKMKDIMAGVPRMVASDLPILIIGGTGDGKTLLAKSIAKEMVPNSPELIKLINCAAIAPELFESEIFGHVKGSFTGADKDRLGKLLTASGFELEALSKKTAGKRDETTHARKEPVRAGTGIRKRGVVILDELATLPLHCQAKLLSVLDGNPIEPVGYDGVGFKPNFRVIATTNESRKLYDEDLFRLDLRKRLEGWVIHMPPLHEQPELIRKLIDEDLPLITDTDGSGQDEVKVAWEEDAILRLIEETSTMKGGIRELKNVIARASIFAHFGSGLRKRVTKSIVDESVSKKLPSIPWKDDSGKENKPDFDQEAEAIVTAIMGQLAKYEISPDSVKKRNSPFLDYKKIGEALKPLPDAKKEEFVQWVMNDEATKKDTGPSADPLLAAVSTRARGTAYGNWRGKNEKQKAKRQG